MIHLSLIVINYFKLLIVDIPLNILCFHSLMSLICRLKLIYGNFSSLNLDLLIR
jgi:hypothetical protein